MQMFFRETSHRFGFQDALERAQKGSEDLDAKIYSKLYAGKAAEKFVNKAEAAALNSDDDEESHSKKTLQVKTVPLILLHFFHLSLFFLLRNA